MNIKLFIALILLFVRCSQSNNINNQAEQNKQTETNKMADIDISMYPVVEGTVRHTIQVQMDDKEVDKKIEIYVSKEYEVDCNSHALIGEFEQKSVAGWGYNYEVFKTNGNLRSTMMGCPDNTLTKKRIFSISKLVRYNSKLPVIVYTPPGYTVNYRIWNRDINELTAIEQ